MATVAHLNETILETVSLGVKREMLNYRNWVEIFFVCVNCEPVLGSSAQLVERKQNCVHHGLSCRAQNSKKADKTWTLTSLYNILQVIVTPQHGLSPPFETFAECCLLRPRVANTREARLVSLLFLTFCYSRPSCFVPGSKCA